MTENSDVVTFICGHGRTVPVGGPVLPECEADVQNLVVPDDGVEREAALRKLLDAPLCVSFGSIHERTEALVGRPVWTHEFARPDGLYREARSQEHPADLEAHVIGSLDQLAGNKPVIIARPGRD